MKVNQPSVYWLDEFGLTLNQLTSLGSLKVKLHVYLRHVDEKSLFRLKPKDRVAKTKAHYELLLAQVKARWNDEPVKVSWNRRQPRGFSASIEARNVHKLLKMPEIGSIWLDEIPGRKRRSLKPQEKWFAVRARFAIQVEGQTKGFQSYEDRIVMVRAISFQDAEKRLLPEFQEYGSPYLNPYGCLARWHFEKVLDVYEVGDEKIDPKGVEVFSVLNRRRMKPEYVWEPERQKEITRK